MTLSVAIGHRLGDFTLDVAFATAGRLTALFGPSGSGKTSIVNAIAGLIRPQSGRIAIDGEPLFDTETGRFVPVHRRRVGYVFQDARLFPHLSVRRNLDYGRYFAARDRSPARFDEVVDLLGLAHLLDRGPAALSGGEKSRVAIGRALLAAPRLLLMDEPLASLDESRRQEILPYIERLRDEAGLAIVYVSHAVSEVARLATDIVALTHGRVAAAGPAAEILARLDLLPEAERGDGGAMLTLTVVGEEPGFGMTVLRSAGGEWRAPRIGLTPGATVRVRVSARDVMLAIAPPAGLSANNVLPVVVTGLEPIDAAEILVRLDCAGDLLIARITRFSAERLALQPGMAAFAVIKAVTFDRAAA